MYVPAGRWYDLRSVDPVEGPAHVLASAGLDDDLPIYARGGSIVPMGPAMQWSDERPVDPLTLHVYVGEDGRATGALYEDDGVTNAYRDGAFSVTTLEAARAHDGMRVEGTVRGRLRRPRAASRSSSTTDEVTSGRRWRTNRNGRSSSAMTTRTARADDAPMGNETNWAGNHVYQVDCILEPRSVEELQEMVRSAHALRVVGSRHSFNDIVDSGGDLVSLDGLTPSIEIDRAAGTVTIEGPVRYGELSRTLDAAGFGLHNLASLPHISVAGACATGTHGSGDSTGSLATAVTALEIVRADGEIERFVADDAGPFSGAVVSLGALGVVIRMTLAVEPRFDIAQVVYEDVPLETFLGSFDEITASAYSVSAFTDWSGPVFHQLWLKSRVGAEPELPAEPSPEERFGGRLAERDLHPIPGYPADACTVQRGIAGPWHDRLPHFRLDHVPSAGDELQTEYLLDRRDLPAALEVLQDLRTRIALLVFVSEVRTIASDDLWLSPSQGRHSAAIHFTWRPDWPGVRDLLPAIEAALEPFEPRPHWGKLFTMAPEVVAARYPHRAAFVEMASQLDPRGVFRNPFVDRYVFQPGAANVSG